MIKILFGGYLIAVFCGLAYPIIEMSLLRYSKVYQSCDTGWARDYRNYPMLIKLIMVFFPVINAIWIGMMVITIKLLLFMVYSSAARKLLMWLAARPTNKWFVFRTKIVKIFFPGRLDFYYTCVQRAHAGDIAEIFVALCVKLIKQGKIEAEKSEKTEKTEINEHTV